MRYAPEVTAQRHERILDEAARMFRERGFAGTGVGDVMQAAGLTHGGFYAHFESKDDLAGKATARAFTALSDVIEKATRAPAPVAALAALYLSPRHRDHPGRGCPLAALGGEVTRQSEGVRTAFSASVRVLLETIARRFRWRRGKDPRQEAIRLAASLVGGLLLARSTNDHVLSDEILRVVRQEWSSYS